jgi:hypothetical protein
MQDIYCFPEIFGYFQVQIEGEPDTVIFRNSWNKFTRKYLVYHVLPANSKAISG